MRHDYWSLTLPVRGNVRLKGESTEDHITRELNALTDPGWEIVHMSHPDLLGPASFVLRVPKAEQ